jgi:peptidoglycan/LPS O-acetylase OafA/YrhL
MPETPPTSPGPMPKAPSARPSRVMLGIVIHAGIMILTCFITPLAMDSNIWPIAGVFWSVLTVPVAVATGALTGWMLKNHRPAIAIPVLVFTGIALATAAAIIMAHNR